MLNHYLIISMLMFSAVACQNKIEENNSKSPQKAADQNTNNKQNKEVSVDSPTLIAPSSITNNNSSNDISTPPSSQNPNGLPRLSPNGTNNSINNSNNNSNNNSINQNQNQNSNSIPSVPRQICSDNSDQFLCEAEIEITNATNRYRADRGLAPLTHDMNMSEVSRLWSIQQSNMRFISHMNMSSRIYDITQRLKTGYRNAGENVAMAGYRLNTPQDVANYFANAWYNSSGHRRNMLGNFSMIGNGVYKNSRGQYYATQIFLLPK